jgi:TolB-like protein
MARTSGRYNGAVKPLIAIIASLVLATTAHAEPSHPTVLLLPFTIINGTGSEWVGDSVQQSLHADLKNSVIGHSASNIADDPAAIARIAHNASVTFVVGGQVQIVENQIRLTATLFNNTGATIGTAKATGEMRKLFDLEDTLADQIHENLVASIRTRLASTPMPTVESSGPIRIAAAKSYPIGTVPVSYSSAALRDGHDRYLYQVPYYGCFGCGGYGCGGYGGYGSFGFGGFGFGIGGVFNGSYSTGGGHSLAW